MQCQLDLRFLPPAKREYVLRQHASIPADGAPLGIEAYGPSVIEPLGYVPDACKHPRPGMLVDDLDLCAAIVPAPPGGEADDCRALYCGYLHAEAWGHFITNSLARLWPAATRGAEIDRYVFFAARPGARLKGNYAELFQLLGIADKVEVLEGPKAYRQVLVPDLAFEAGGKAHPEYAALIALIRRAAIGQEQAPAAGRPLFFTRSRLPRARGADIGIGLIDELYAGAGYAVEAPERLGLAQMIRMIAAAPRVAFISGSGAHNSIFAAPGQEVHIIERDAICNIFQPAIEESFAHKTAYVQASCSLLPCAYGRGPYLYAPTPWLLAYAQDQGMAAPRRTPRQLRRDFRRYLRQRQRLYRCRWWIDDWADDQTAVFLEAYRHARDAYADCVGGAGPVYASPLRRLLRRLKHWACRRLQH